MRNVIEDLKGLQVYHNELFPTLQSVNESITSQANNILPPAPKFFTPGIFIEKEGYGQNFLKNTSPLNNALEPDLTSIKKLFPDAKDARFGLMYGTLKGTFIYFANEHAAQFARETCVQKSQLLNIHAFCYIRAPRERGGVPIKLQQKIRIKKLIGYSMVHAREFLRAALIKCFMYPKCEKRNEQVL